MESYDFLFNLLLKLVIVAAVLERAVGQIKKLVRIDWAHPWPLVSFLVAAVFVFGYDLPMIETIVQHEAHAKAVAFLDLLLSSLILSGGAAAIIDLAKKIAKQRDELHAIRKGNHQ